MRLVLPLLACAVFAVAQEQPPVSAFRFKTDKRVKKDAKLDLEEVRQGVRQPRGQPDPRDVIPAIDDPKSVPAARATWLRGNARVLGVVVNGEARAYPLKTLERHEMVNDRLGGVPIAPNY